MGSAIAGLRPRLPRPEALVVIALAAGFVFWLGRTSQGPASLAPAVARPIPPPSSRSAAPSRPRSLAFGPVVLGARELRAQAAAFGQAVWWAGPLTGRRYELSRSKTGNVLVRYLPRGVRAGDRRAFPTVGTYPVANAFATSVELAGKPGFVGRKLSGGGFAYYRETRPTSVYVVYPDLEYEIEVFDPSPARARGLVAGGRIRPLR